MVTNTIEVYDIVVVGAGPVGLLLATCLARFGFRTKVVDKRHTPTLTGRADGIQPRSLDILRNLGLKRAIMAHEPAKVYEVAFWDPMREGEGIHRTSISRACPPFVEARYPFATCLHQGLIEGVFIADLRKNGVEVERPLAIVNFSNDRNDEPHPVEVILEHTESGEQQTVKTKYLFSGEGAKSFIRERLGIQIHHKDRVMNVWGVMDGVVETDFPDIKMKCTIHSQQGSIMIIPRENNLVRLYIQLATSSDEDFDPHRQATVVEVQNAAKQILKPYHIEWERIEWYSTYPIDQGIAERYTLDNRVFMGGDCCHTHSPKAGQGMNTAFHDALNLAWKLHLVESGFANESVLDTYESERKMIAEELLDFDARYAALFSRRLPPISKRASEKADIADGHETNASEEFLNAFKESQEFTSGYGIAYHGNVFNWSLLHPAQSLVFDPSGHKLTAGRVMPHTDVTRVADANVVKLEHEIPLNGSFRLFVFAGKPDYSKQALTDFASNLQKQQSFLAVYPHQDARSVSYHERHNPHSPFFSICIIFTAPRSQIVIESLPPLLSRYREHVYTDDVMCPAMQDTGPRAHFKMGFSEDRGGVIVVRPDGHVSCVVGLVEGSGTVDALNQYFNAFSTKRLGGVQSRL
ncbi:uncharacterized protein KY384_007664 [Bacidia gigantensis]|uniref:uncharacterized protein n=1 Tax=Bacidia gigantensis TaxID=2732470 RepID=UPI001D04EC41|nr:uncharacterized protein KY384_007664 [Bacidia gigantensis]KAG8527512.1 hypothetical protein KY384_007664 [Bacidia gigantensis]